MTSALPAWLHPTSSGPSTGAPPLQALLQSNELLSASSTGDYKQVVALLRAGADANTKCREQFNERPLHRAAAGGHVGVVQALLQSRAKVDAKGRDGMRPLHYSAACGHVNAVRALLGAGASVHDVTTSGQTALHVAASRGMVAAAVVLVQAGASMQVKDKAGITPLDVAAPEVRRAMLQAPL